MKRLATFASSVLALLAVAVMIGGCGGGNSATGTPNLPVPPTTMTTMAWANVVNLPVNSKLQVALDRADGVHLHPATVLGVYNVITNMRLLVCQLTESNMIILEGDSGSPVYYTDPAGKIWQVVDVALTTSGATPMFMGNCHADVEAEGPTKNLNRVTNIGKITWKGQEFKPAASRCEIMADARTIDRLNHKYGTSLSAIDSTKKGIKGGPSVSGANIVPGSTVAAEESAGYIVSGMGYAVSSMNGTIWHGTAHPMNGNGPNATPVVAAKVLGPIVDPIWGSSKLFSLGEPVSTMIWDGPNGSKMDSTIPPSQFSVTVNATIDGKLAKFSPAISQVTRHDGSSMEQSITESCIESPVIDVVGITTPGQATGTLRIKYPGLAEQSLAFALPKANATSPSSDIAWEIESQISSLFDQLKKSDMSPEYVTLDMSITTTPKVQVWVKFVDKDGNTSVPAIGTIFLMPGVYHVTVQNRVRFWEI